MANERVGTAQRRSGPRLSADERKRSVLIAAMSEFAIRGFAGTSTEDIARRAGISQPYLFRLFGTKRDLFIATMQLMHERIETAFRTAAKGLGGIEAMVAMGSAYRELLAERDLLLVQMHAFAASSDLAIRDAARAGLYRVWTVTEELTGLPDEDIRAFFAQGMLLNVIEAIDAGALSKSWALACEVSPEQFREQLSTP